MSDLISRQAAINTVKKHYRVDNDLLEVIVYQLENLPSVQSEPCEDAVSREWLISELRNRKVLFCKNQIEFKLLPKKDKARVDEIDAWIGEVLNAPSVTPKQRMGEWVPQDFNKSNGMSATLVYYYPKCSLCGASANYTNYCPNCGAKMNGGDQAEENCPNS